ncbi:MAG: paraquat-inducible protein A [Candidatus Aminicenantes bacterium]|nr:MAG: paraquat-inducible protein A [Candidatus Aminicenantes bacterium]
MWPKKSKSRLDQNGAKKLKKQTLKNLEVHLLIWLSLITLGIGISAPILTFKKLIFYKRTFSILSGLESLFKEGEYFLFLIIGAFSVLFPIAKILLLSIIWYFRSLPKQKAQKYLYYLGGISKWSMLDVFIVAILVVIVRLDVLGKIEVHWGIYIFAASVILSIFASSRLSRRIISL